MQFLFHIFACYLLFSPKVFRPYLHICISIKTTLPERHLAEIPRCKLQPCLESVPYNLYSSCVNLENQSPTYLAPPLIAIVCCSELQYFSTVHINSNVYVALAYSNQGVGLLPILHCLGPSILTLVVLLSIKTHGLISRHSPGTTATKILLLHR